MFRNFIGTTSSPIDLVSSGTLGGGGRSIHRWKEGGGDLPRIFRFTGGRGATQGLILRVIIIIVPLK